jgi:hypothetical protein
VLKPVVEDGDVRAFGRSGLDPTHTVPRGDDGDARVPTTVEEDLVLSIPRCASVRASQAATGVLPVPPTARFPTETTGIGPRLPGRTPLS